MNNNRRKELSRLASRMAELTDELSTLKDLIEMVRDEEQDALEALPDSFREGDRGQTMQEALDALEEVLAELDNVIGADLTQRLEDAGA